MATATFQRAFVGGKFSLGRTVMTAGVNDKVAEDARFAAFVLRSLRRHANGDWGDLDDHDKRENELALKHNYRRIFSAYNAGATKIWIITEWDRSATTVLFPSEY